MTPHKSYNNKHIDNHDGEQGATTSKGNDKRLKCATASQQSTTTKRDDDCDGECEPGHRSVSTRSQTRMLQTATSNTNNGGVKHNEEEEPSQLQEEENSVVTTKKMDTTTPKEMGDPQDLMELMREMQHKCKRWRGDGGTIQDGLRGKKGSEQGSFHDRDGLNGWYATIYANVHGGTFTRAVHSSSLQEV
ncbi:hypothetical protein LR48_Vigan306s001500 [Vigna angularis]|uniref:Uncharacterized protein n=1 Tax=Phaseolus angularis TaxID=3914 RepID=A0A0L9T810_PHAAN|nr:hypothetical protein LR48_Vigan306s001500 [Vigna angularis]